MPDRQSKELMSALAIVAPGQPLREGLDRILKASMGALIVVGDGPEVLNISSGGFLVNAAYSPQRLSELAKTDGAIVLTSDTGYIARANVHLVPNPNVPTEETGTRHRTAERVARSIGVPVISVSEDMAVVTVYTKSQRYQLEPIPWILGRCNQALQTLERYKARLNEESTNLTALEVEDVVTLRDVAAVVQRGEMVHRIADEIETMIVELGVDARLLRLQLDELYVEIDDEIDLVIGDYLPNGHTVAEAHQAMAELDSDDVLDLRKTSLALVPANGADDLDQSMAPKGLRLLARVPRLNTDTAVAITNFFGELTKLQRATVADLLVVPGVSTTQAQAIKDTLARVVEATIMDQYT